MSKKIEESLLEKIKESLEKENEELVVKFIKKKINSKILQGRFVEEALNVREMIKDKLIKLDRAEMLEKFINNIEHKEKSQLKNVIKAEKILLGDNYQRIKEIRFQNLVSSDNARIPFLLNQAHLIHLIAQADLPIEFAKILHKKSCNLAPIDHVGNTPLIWSVANSSNRFAYDFLEFAKANTADIGINEADKSFAHNTALHLAVAKGYFKENFNGKPLSISNYQITKKLIECKASPNLKNKYDLTALDLAVLRADLEMVTEVFKSDLLEQTTIKKSQETLDQLIKRSWEMPKLIEANNPNEQQQNLDSEMYRSPTENKTKNIDTKEMCELDKCLLEVSKTIHQTADTFLSLNSENFSDENLKKLKEILNQEKTAQPNNSPNPKNNKKVRDHSIPICTIS